MKAITITKSEASMLWLAMAQPTVELKSAERFRKATSAIEQIEGWFGPHEQPSVVDNGQHGWRFDYGDETRELVFDDGEFSIVQEYVSVFNRGILLGQPFQRGVMLALDAALAAAHDPRKNGQAVPCKPADSPQDARA